MAHTLIQLDYLPDEILVFIFKKLHNSDVLYSLIDFLLIFVDEYEFFRKLKIKTTVKRKYKYYFVTSSIKIL